MKFDRDGKFVQSEGDPPVTVIVTVYNRTSYIKDALRGVIEQTFKSYEVIITDDSSNDSSSDSVRAICASFGDSRIRYRKNQITLGVALNLRMAMREARGRYIAILNDDDVWEPDFLERLIPPLDRDPTVVLSFCDYWLMACDGSIDVTNTDEDTRRSGRNVLPEGIITNLQDIVIEKNGIQIAIASVFRKNAIDMDRLVPDIAWAYDYWIACLLAHSGGVGYYIPKRLTRYRIHAEMESMRKAPDKNKNKIFICEKLLEFNYFEQKRDLVYKKYGRDLLEVGKNYLRFGMPLVARCYFWGSFSITSNYKALAGIVLTYLPNKLRIALRITYRDTDVPSGVVVHHN
jgi:glycosyltransferase involved in cell wall biosynthesis